MSTNSSQIVPYRGAWTEVQIKHLLRRTLFGVSRTDYAFFKNKSMDECIQILLTARPMPLLPVIPPNYYENKPAPLRSFVLNPDPSDASTEEYYAMLLKGWWAGHMFDPQRSISEKMGLFWHNHFPIEFGMVKDSRYEYQYLMLLKEHSLGNFKKLLKAITVNPGMLAYLNGNLNSAAQLNENYGRELQELFTVGKGPESHYTEADVKAAAKVLSGWKDDKRNVCSYFDASAHDTDDKTFSAFYGHRVIKGRSGDDGSKETDEMIEMICSQKEVSKFLCRKIYRWFVHSHIDMQVEERVITPLSEVMIKSNYEIMPVLKSLLSSDFFYDPLLIGGMFKSPVDFIIGLMNMCEAKMEDTPQARIMSRCFLALAAKMVGQDVGDPPSVAGWPAYYEFPFYDKNWVTSESFFSRSKLITMLSYPNKENEIYTEFDFIAFISSFPDPGSAEAIISASLDLLCCIRPGANQTASLLATLNTGTQWTELWSKYKVNTGQNEVKTEVADRLKNFYNTIFGLPEFQIM